VPFKEEYGGGSHAQGFFVSDTVNIQGAVLESLEFGWVYDYTANSITELPGTAGASGIAGIGFVQQESTGGQGASYPNLPSAMYQAGLINTVAYSIYAGSVDNQTGQILFGGVDTAKYSGQLTTMEMTNADSDILVPITGLTVSKGDSSQSLLSAPAIALLDSGSTDFLLPAELLQPIIDLTGAVNDTDGQALIAPCSLRTSDLSVTMSFGSVDIKLSAADLIFPEGYSNTFYTGSTLEYNGEPYCQLAPGMNPHVQGIPFIVPGDPFFRSAYTVIDLSGKKVSMAPIVDTTDENIVEIYLDENGNAVLPSATTVSYSAATALLNLATETGSLTISNVSPSTTTDSSSTATSGSSSGSGSGSGSGSHQSSAVRSAEGPFEALLAQSTLAIIFAGVGGYLLF
jgi:hypothetical protein